MQREGPGPSCQDLFPTKEIPLNNEAKPKERGMIFEFLITILLQMSPKEASKAIQLCEAVV